jgi:glycosyltransferase involved in cell wall biosynthesis
MGLLSTSEQPCRRGSGIVSQARGGGQRRHRFFTTRSQESRQTISLPALAFHQTESGPFPALKQSAEEPGPFKLSLPTRVAFIGNYLPRQCGIATFTTDLCVAMGAEYGVGRMFAIPVNDPDSSYQYPEAVRLELEQEDCSSYQRAADFLNFNGNDLVCLQHEYGIFGGPAGAHILTLLRRLRMPLVTTLHTVLRNPDRNQRAVLEEIAQLSDRLIVMSEHAADLLREVYDLPGAKIDVIPHGVPDLPFMDPNYFKDKFGTEGKSVLLTFGLLSPNKGVENVISALPAILARHPDLVYIVSGATHPHIKRREKEQYREALTVLAEKLGVGSHVIFNNRFVSNEELIEHVGAADIYITPYRQEAQVVSGTLAIAIGAGKAIISTPYWHATELLADGRGVMVPFDDPAAIAEAAVALLDNDAERHAMRKRAYLHSRSTTWPKTARAYMASFQRARAARMSRPRAARDETATLEESASLPTLNMDHLLSMTDDTGILQHAIFSLPNCLEGYTTDDNARALIVAVLLNGSSHAGLSRRYLTFLWHAFNDATGRFRNFLSYDRAWLEESGSEDSHGRALWAVGTVLGKTKDPGLRGAAGRLFEKAFPAASTFRSPRAWAFSILGMQAYLDWFPGDRVVQGARNLLANRLLDIYRRASSPGWHWFETGLSYSNARLPQALLLTGYESENATMLEAGCESLRWLLAEQHRAGNDIFVPIGSMGFFAEGGGKARFDQQPVEACATIAACLLAHRVTSGKHWLDEAWSAFRWFLGANDLEIPLYDPATGGCKDGLHPDRVNENQGAESTLSFLLALLDMQSLEVHTAPQPQQETSVSL